MGEKGLKSAVQDVINKLPPGYHIVQDQLQGAYQDTVHAEPDGRPGYPLGWDEGHDTWMPPGFTHDPADPDRIFNQTTGQNGVWGDSHWIDAQTGAQLGYEQ